MASIPPPDGRANHAHHAHSSPKSSKTLTQNIIKSGGASITPFRNSASVTALGRQGRSQPIHKNADGKTRSVTREPAGSTEKATRAFQSITRL